MLYCYRGYKNNGQEWGMNGWRTIVITTLLIGLLFMQGFHSSMMIKFSNISQLSTAKFPTISWPFRLRNFFANSNPFLLNPCYLQLFLWVEWLYLREKKDFVVCNQVPKWLWPVLMPQVSKSFFVRISHPLWQIPNQFSAMNGLN